MPIKPIDLQTLFMQLGQVGREQAAGKEGAALQGAVKAAADQKRLDERKEAVSGTRDPEGGPKKVQDRQTGRGAPESREREREGPEGQESAPEEFVKDPDLGNRLDISG